MSSLREAAEGLLVAADRIVNGGTGSDSIGLLLIEVIALRQALSLPNERERLESDQPTYTDALLALDAADKRGERLEAALRGAGRIDGGYGRYGTEKKGEWHLHDCVGRPGCTRPCMNARAALAPKQQERCPRCDGEGWVGRPSGTSLGGTQEVVGEPCPSCTGERVGQG